MDINTYFTPEMANRMAQTAEADLRRRSAKLHRLNPDASPYTNLMSQSLDYAEGDPERLQDFVQNMAFLAQTPVS